MKRTYTATAADKNKTWAFVNADGRILGDVATEIAAKLIGKHKVTYTANINVGDKVVVTNASKLVVTGNKALDKKYYQFTGYLGGLKTETFEAKMARKPEQVLMIAVSGMLPKNKLRKERLANLYIYAGADHKHVAAKKAE